MKKQTTIQEESKEETLSDVADLQDITPLEKPKILIEELASPISENQALKKSPKAVK